MNQAFINEFIDYFLDQFSTDLFNNQTCGGCVFETKREIQKKSK